MNPEEQLVRGYRRCLLLMTTGETELQRGVCWCVCSEVFSVKPHTKGRLEPRPDERSVCSTLLLLLPFTHSLALARAGTRRESGLAFLQEVQGWWIPTHLRLRLPSTSKPSYLLGLPVEGVKGASFFCFGFTWTILALPVLSEDISLNFFSIVLLSCATLNRRT